MRISFKSELDKLSKDLNIIQLSILNKSTVQALNRTIKKVRTEASTAIREEANLTKQRVDRELVESKANKSRLFAAINSRSAKATNLIEHVSGDVSRFRRRTKKGAFTKSAQAGVRARPYEKSKTYKGAFIGTGKNSGKTLVFKRSGKGRGAKLEVVHGASPRTIFKRTDTQVRLQAKARREFSIELDSALRLNLRRLRR